MAHRATHQDQDEILMHIYCFVGLFSIEYVRNKNCTLVAFLVPFMYPLHWVRYKS
jgi:hypothetical protein